MAMAGLSSLPTVGKLSSLALVFTLLYLLSLHLQPSSSPGREGGNRSEAAGVPLCPGNFTHYCPCQDPSRERRFHSHSVVMFHRERHCPPPDEKPRCRVPPPRGYRRTLPWPQSLRRAWFANVPFRRLSVDKASQNWVRVEGDVLVFPGGGTSFAGGVEEYVKGIAKLLPLKGGQIRTALDIGCGVASFGGNLLDYNIVTVSVAPRDVHEAQVQFALERGLPAMLGVLSVHRLPYPSRSFDMAHCSRCLVKWADNGGLYLIEIDRVLRPGGYWVLSGPPINWKDFYKGWQRSPGDLQEEQNAIEDLAKKLCWKKVAEDGPIAVWRKPINHAECKENKTSTPGSLPFCEEVDPDDAWYTDMHACISPLPSIEVADQVAGGALKKWPERLMAPPPRVLLGTIKGITARSFKEDCEIWNQRILFYEAHIRPFSEGRYRNIMDMNAGLGGFASALNKYPVWVMNVVPYGTGSNTLGIIYQRGLIGTYMDWCEAFSTYPRTYDLIHADGVFTIYMNKCEVMNILLEIDRILRPEGTVIIRDRVETIAKIQKASDSLKWQSRTVETEKGPLDPVKLLIVDKSPPSS